MLTKNCSRLSSEQRHDIKILLLPDLSYNCPCLGNQTLDVTPMPLPPWHCLWFLLSGISEIYHLSTFYLKQKCLSLQCTNLFFRLIAFQILSCIHLAAFHFFVFIQTLMTSITLNDLAFLDFPLTRWVFWELSNLMVSSLIGFTQTLFRLEVIRSLVRISLLSRRKIRSLTLWASISQGQCWWDLQWF